jgi:FKBP-type peptidyl-prolyl cis-trans isomerase (trigger factor)
MEKQYNVTVTHLPDAEVEIKGEISWEAFVKFEQKAFARLAEHLELPGFRKGFVPEDVAKKHLDDELVLADMAELAVQEFYPKIIADEGLDVIGRPRLAITKITRDNALGFVITTAILPEIKLPEYKKIAKDIPQLEADPVTEENVEKVVQELRQLRAYGHVHQEGDGHEHAHDEPLPEVDDAFAQSFGNFKTVDELRAKVRENVAREKDQEVKDKRRIAIMDAILAKTEFTVPAIVLQSEQDKMYAQIEADVSRAGFTIEDYLKHVSKTKSEMMEEFKPEAEKRARFQLVINAIARKEKISPTDEEVAAEAERLVAAYPGADLNRSKAYADMVLTNEKTFNMLEAQ